MDKQSTQKEIIDEYLDYLLEIGAADAYHIYESGRLMADAFHEQNIYAWRHELTEQERMHIRQDIFESLKNTGIVAQDIESITNKCMEGIAETLIEPQMFSGRNSL